MFSELNLFIGALLDALIGPNLFVPGEPFMITAGYQLQQGFWGGVIAVFFGGFLGDQLSYLIGLKFGKPAQSRLIRWQPKMSRSIARCRLLMAKKGNFILAFARLLGPISWGVPFIAGTTKVSWSRFTFYSAIGLCLGVGQFVMWGYLIGLGFDKLPILNEIKTILVEHQYSLIALLVAILFLYVGFKFKLRFLLTKTLSIFLMAMLIVNYNHFFLLADDFLLETPVSKNHQTYTDINNIDYKVYPGKSSFFDAQAMNVVYFGESPKSLMSQLGWIENRTFSRNDLEWEDYVNLMKSKTPPISDLFWNNTPQDLAFQMPGSLMKRSHIRWWKGGVDANSNQIIWLGAISYDEGLTLSLYSGIITVLHSVDTNVDLERDKLIKQVESAIPDLDLELVKLTSPIAIDENHSYYSDGKVFVINKKTTELARNQ